MRELFPVDLLSLISLAEMKKPLYQMAYEIAGIFVQKL